MSSVDNFQGEESRIIIVSLVRIKARMRLAAELDSSRQKAVTRCYFREPRRPCICSAKRHFWSANLTCGPKLSICFGTTTLLAKGSQFTAKITPSGYEALRVRRCLRLSVHKAVAHCRAISSCQIAATRAHYCAIQISRITAAFFVRSLVPRRELRVNTFAKRFVAKIVVRV